MPFCKLKSANAYLMSENVERQPQDPILIYNFVEKNDKPNMGQNSQENVDNS
jgi:hypothetical protein